MRAERWRVQIYFLLTLCCLSIAVGASGEELPGCLRSGELEQACVLKIHGDLVISSPQTLTTNGFPLDIKIYGDLIIRDTWTIRSFPSRKFIPPGEHGVPGASGKTPGKIEIEVEDDARGNLIVLNYGTDGGDGWPGRDGAKGRTGTSGQPGLDGFLVCRRGPIRGGPGDDGGNGGRGSDGGDGGDGGEVSIDVDGGFSEFNLQLNVEPGGPGTGGAAGRPGSGGEGGPGGSGSVFCSGPAARGPSGRLGKPGKRGNDGDSGSPGKVDVEPRKLKERTEFVEVGDVNHD